MSTQPRTTRAKIHVVTVERCEECGFDGDEWTDASATAAILELPERWRESLSTLADPDLQRRRIADMWSIAEYADHVREVLFGMRFLLDTAVARPGIDIGDAPEPRFDPTARRIDVRFALDGIRSEAEQLGRRLGELGVTDWDATVVVGGTEVDGHWIARHAVHDATHHLLDAQRLGVL
jgi:hypothetical protein